MVNIIYAQWLKTRRTPLRMIILACPVLFSLLLLIYRLMSSTISGKEVESFFLLFAIVSNFSLSFFIPMLYQPDKEAALYANELRIGRKRALLFVSRFALTVLLFAFMELLAIMTFALGQVFVIKISINLVHVSVLALISFMTVLPLIVFYQVICLQLNYVGSILFGSFFSLASILLGTTDLGATVWKWLPFVWNIKLLTTYSNTIHSGGGETNLYLYLSAAFLLTMIFMFFAILWYNRWSGMTQLEE